MEITSVQQVLLSSRIDNQAEGAQTQLLQYSLTANSLATLNSIVSDSTIAPTSVSPIADSLPTTQTEADLQVAGLLAFIDRMMQSSDSSAKSAIAWAVSKIKALQNSSLLDDTFSKMATDGLSALDPKKTLNDWNTFWTGEIKPIEDQFQSWQTKSASDLVGDEDTMFSTVMLFLDFTERGQKVYDPGFFGQKGGEISLASYAEFSRFTALYLFEQTQSGGLQLSDLNKIAQDLDGGTKSTDDPNLYMFFHGDGPISASSSGLEAIIADITASGKWDSKFGPADLLFNDSINLWKIMLGLAV